MTTERDACLREFLARSGWDAAERSVLAGDASNRRYDRLKDAGLGNAVLMDAPPNEGEGTRPFIKIATHLRGIGLSAPQILAQDVDQGFLIIEDLGDDLFARVLSDNLELEPTLYAAATDALFHAQRASAPANLGQYGPTEMAQTALRVPDWYLKYAAPDAPDIRQVFHDRIYALLTQYLTGPSVLVQRDYHAENLLWIPKRAAPGNVGLLDFQDAALGHPAYDLASLLKDARRDVSPAVQQDCIAQFIALTDANPDAFAAAYAVCSAQRNLRIIGGFARLSIRDGKRHYPDMLPRVWRNLKDDLTHPILKDFGDWILSILPAPTPQIIARLKLANV
ncbi:phosphotransferase [Litoreibacter sp.]|nr:phosphotransferase [Litoreibacter sp.]